MRDIDPRSFDDPRDDGYGRELSQGSRGGMSDPGLEEGPRRGTQAFLAIGPPRQRRLRCDDLRREAALPPDKREQVPQQRGFAPMPASRSAGVFCRPGRLQKKEWG